MSKRESHIVFDHEELQIISTQGYDGAKLLHHFRRARLEEAEFAMLLLRAHAGVTAREDGQDDAGRAKVRRDQPAEAVAYACEVAALAFAEFKKRNWLQEIPGWEEIEERAKPQN